jgi:hypothetical protein
MREKSEKYQNISVNISVYNNSVQLKISKLFFQCNMSSKFNKILIKMRLKNKKK